MQQAEKLRDLVLDALEEIRAQDVCTLEVTDISDITDFMIIATGRSDRHVRAVAESVMESLREADFRPIGKEGLEAAQWVLLDYGDVIVHIMRQQTRDYYDLESLWGEQVRDLVRKNRDNPME